MDEQVKFALEHAWRHFQMHAEQRITVFNFFVATAGLLVTGLAFTLQASRDTWPLGVAAGLLLALLAFIFSKLDARVSRIIKSSEEVIMEAETRVIDEPALRAMSKEREMTALARRGLLGVWTYGRSFRLIFGLMAGVGIGGALYSLTRAPLPSIKISWHVSNQ